MDAIPLPLPPVALARRALACLDLTSLGEDDDRARIEALCDAARLAPAAPAALCVYPEWVATVRRRIDRDGPTGTALATVVNFPDGGADPARVVRETRRAIAAGADEIDVVLPWRALLAGDMPAARAVLAACREACGARALMKVILETAELGETRRVHEASLLALDEGADFLKTSTGKAGGGATPEAASTMLGAIAARGGGCGFKASGGIRTLADAARYFALADNALGPAWGTPRRFRIGASALLAEIVRVVDGAPATGAGAG
jgi:deoxyribose-phosphate aldolase